MASQGSSKTVLLAVTATVLAVSAVSLYLFNNQKDDSRAPDAEEETREFSHSTRVVPVDLEKEAKPTIAAKAGDSKDRGSVGASSDGVAKTTVAFENPSENQNPLEENSEGASTATSTNAATENPLVTPDKMKVLQRRSKKNQHSGKKGQSTQVSAAKQAILDQQALAGKKGAKKNKKKKFAQ